MYAIALKGIGVQKRNTTAGDAFEVARRALTLTARLRNHRAASYPH